MFELLKVLGRIYQLNLGLLSPEDIIDVDFQTDPLSVLRNAGIHDVYNSDKYTLEMLVLEVLCNLSPVSKYIRVFTWTRLEDKILVFSNYVNRGPDTTFPCKVFCVYNGKNRSYYWACKK